MGKETDTKYMICSYLKAHSDDPDRSWPLVLASFDEMASPRPGTWGAILLFVTGDLEFVCNDLGLPHFNSNQCCALCCANVSDKPHNNYHNDAAWRGTLRTSDEFRAALRQPLHPLVAWHSFSRFTYRLDLLHLLDHHGVASHVVANVIANFVEQASETVPGESQESRLNFINDDIRGFYTDRHVQNRMPPLKIANLYMNGFPELHGPAVKAANTRALVQYAMCLQDRSTAADPSSENRHCLKVAQSLSDAYELMYAANYFLTVDEQKKLDKLLHRMGVNWQLLAVLTCRGGAQKWKQPIKLHYAVGHLAQQATLINPRFVQCYGSEGLVGQFSNIWKTSQDGPFEATIQKKILGKYRTGMTIDFSP